MMSLSDSPMIAGVLKTMAIAALIGGGGTVLSNKIDNVRQDVQLQQVSELSENLTKLNENVQETDKNLAVLNERLRALGNEQSN